MSVKIRPITLKDVASYRRCWDVVAKERRYIFWYEAPSVSNLRTSLRKSFRKKTPFLVAVEDERVVGWAAVFSPNIPALKHNGDLMVMLLPEYRRMGLGTKLAAGVLKMARSKFDGVILTVVRKNRPAQKFFKKLGFETCATEKKAVKLVYGFDDVLIMQKQMWH